MRSTISKITIKKLLLRKKQLIEELVISNRKTKQTGTWTKKALIEELIAYNKNTPNMKKLKRKQLIEICFPSFRAVVENQLLPFFKSVLKQGYVRNGTVNDPDPTRVGAHEKKIMELLRHHSLMFIRHPYGRMKAVDLRVYLTPTKFLDLELKSHGTYGFPLFGSTPPKEGVVYIFCSGKYNKTTIFFGQDVLDKKYHELYDQLNSEIQVLTKQFVKQHRWHDPSRGFTATARPQCVQRGKASLTDFFTPALRLECERKVFSRLGDVNNYEGWKK